MSDSTRVNISTSPTERAGDAAAFDAVREPEGLTRSIRTGNDAGRVTFRNGGMAHEDTSVRVVNTSDFAGVAGAMGAAKASVAATARSKLGSPIAPSQITPESLVTLPNGMQVEARVAERAGFLTRNPQTGTYTDPFEIPAAANADQPQEQAQGEPQDGDAVALPAEADEAVLGRMIEATPPSEQIAVVEAIIDGEDLGEGVFERLAERTGITPTEAAAAIGHIHSQMKAQADAITGECGLDPEAVYEWAWEHHPDRMRAAIRRHTGERSLKGYAELRDEYLRNLDKHDPEAAGESLDVSGISYRIVQGRIIISTPIGEMSWTSAVKGGFLKVSRR